VADDFCCQQCTETAAALRASLSAARDVLESALLVRETEDFLKEMAS
jgi:hypothetical protein